MTSAILEQPQTLTARELLRAATDDFKAKREASEDAKGVVHRAEAAVGSAKSILQSFDDLPQRIQAHHINALKADKDLTLPAELRDQQRERLYAREQLEHAATAFQTVQIKLVDSDESLVLSNSPL